MIGKTPFASASLNITNVALKKQANQTSTWMGYTDTALTGDHPGLAEYAVDGDTNGNYKTGKSVTSTNLHNPGELPDNTIFWTVNLAGSYVISKIKVYNRLDYGMDRLRGFYVEIHDANDAVIWTTKTTPMVDKGNSNSVPLELCEGDCDNNGHCTEGLTCENRNSSEAISQCTGQSGMPVSHDFCTVPTTPLDITTFNIASPVIGNTVWVKLDVDAPGRLLSLAEVEVYGRDMTEEEAYQISLIEGSIDVAFNDSRIESEIMMDLNITTDSVPKLSNPIKVFDYDTCKTTEYNSLMLSTFVADDNVTNNGVFSTVPVGVNLNTTDIVSFNNSEEYPGFFNAQDESVILQFCLKPTLGSSEVYNATTGKAVQTYISYTKIKVQINLDMNMDFSSAAVSIKEDAPKQSTKEVTVDYTLDAYECDAATKVRIENPSTKTQNSLVTVCIESTFDDIIIGDIKELTLTQSTSGLTSVAIANSNSNSITEVSNIGTKKAAVSTRLVGAFFTDLADGTESTIDIAGIAVLMFGSGGRRLVRIGNGANRQSDTAAADRVLEEETVDDPLGEFAVSMGISTKNVGGAASAATKAKKVLASLFSAAIGMLVL